MVESVHFHPTVGLLEMKKKWNEMSLILHEKKKIKVSLEEVTNRDWFYKIGHLLPENPPA